MRKFAFTLAEVLITLAIIGVVAAMTMPTLIQNHQKRSLEVATKKFYSMMSQAIKHYMADEGIDDLRNSPMTDMGTENSDIDVEDTVYNFVRKYLKVAKECEDNCFAETYQTQSNEISSGIGSSAASGDGYPGMFVLSDGMVLYIQPGDYGYPIVLYVDVNGKKGPNKIGYDLWGMDIFYDGTIDESGINPECKQGKEAKDGQYYLCGGHGTTPSEVRKNKFEQCLDASNYGGCFGHFMENGFKFDY